MRNLILIAALLANGSAIADTSEVSAANDTITAKHRYMLGDNDSRSDATNICFLNAKRKAIEYAGAYFQSISQITQSDTTRHAKDSYKSYASALVSTEMVSNDLGLEDGKAFLDCVVVAKLDSSSVKQEIATIASDPNAKKQIQQQQIALKNLENELAEIQTRLKLASSNQAIALRQERTAVFKEFDRLQKQKLIITSAMKSMSNDAEQLVAKGMTFKEVLSLIGNPRIKAIDYCVVTYQSWNYGTIWVNFYNGIVDNVGEHKDIQTGICNSVLLE